MTMAAANPFWDFSLAVYRRPGVAAACLRLQDEAGVDVNLLLYFCWLATVQAAALDEAVVRQAVARTELWREDVVRPLRALRRRMKDGIEGMPSESAEALRTEVKRIELQSERLQQDMLFALSGTEVAEAAAGPDVRRRAEENIAKYLDVIGIPRSEPVNRDCRVVIDGGLVG
jgi:uncharacterized protein (TIGR02444 family)